MLENNGKMKLGIHMKMNVLTFKLYTLAQIQMSNVSFLSHQQINNQANNVRKA